MNCILKLAAVAGVSLAFLSAPAMAEKAAAPGPVAKACKAEAKKYCVQAKTEEEIKACLDEHKAHTSKKCKKALAK